MNKSRINRAIGHIDELIALCERELRADARVHPARESLAYLEFVIKSYMKYVDDIKDAEDRASTLESILGRISREIDREPPHSPLSLGP